MGNKFLLKGIEKNGQHYPGNTENHLFLTISPLTDQVNPEKFKV